MTTGRRVGGRKGYSNNQPRGSKIVVVVVMVMRG